MIHKRVSLRDVARAAGLSHATVSLALRDSPLVASDTKDRIKKLVVELGYSPDPMLSALAAYRNGRRPVSFQGSLAWLVNDVPPFDWRRIPVFQEYFKGATESAKNHGFNLRIFDLNAPQMTADRMSRVLRACNISGILVSPQPQANSELVFPWEDFSAVTFGYSLAKPALHCVAPTQYRATLLAMRHIRAQGYQRIGLATTSTADERVNHNSLAAYLAETYLHDGEPIVLPFKLGGYTAREIHAWIRKTKVEVALVSLDIMDTLKDSGLEQLGDVAVACTGINECDGKIAGIKENSELAGEVAVNLLVAMIQRGERGVPTIPQHVLIEGDWIPGATLPPRKEKVSRRPKASKSMRVAA